MNNVLKIFVSVGSFLALSGCASVNSDSGNPTFSQLNSQLKELTSNEVVTFTGQEEFERYRSRLYELGAEIDARWATGSPDPGRPLYAQAIVDCTSGGIDCDELEEVLVTGSSVAGTSRTSVTNTQEANVDEGDIVKRYKNFLVVLQDGRLFSVDMGQTAGGLRLIDRVNVYQDSSVDAWYDEMLIHEDLIVVTAFNYSLDQTDVDVFRITDDGRFERVVTYSIQAYDYFSGENYATRLVDGKLILYSPLPIVDFVDADKIQLPHYRTRKPGQSYTEWQPLLEYSDVYRPNASTLMPVIHTIVMCDISEIEASTCEATGMVGGGAHEFYVSEESAYIWLADTEFLDEYWWYSEFENSNCSQQNLENEQNVLPSVLYKLDLVGNTLTAVRSAGFPIDQFSIAERDDVIWVLSEWLKTDCSYEFDDPSIRLIEVNKSQLGKTLAPFNESSSTQMVRPKGKGLENRFSSTHLVIGSRDSYWHGPGFWDTDSLRVGELTITPLSNPKESVVLGAAHNIQRLETFGEAILATGYKDDRGLHISMLSPGSENPVVQTIYLPGQFESEGRSHAVNMIVEEDGSGLFGLPLARATQQTYRGRTYSQLEDHADVGFFNVSNALQMSFAGQLDSSGEYDVDDYECEMSCYGWYGNTRPIFIEGRIFGLTGSELIEGVMIDSQLYEYGRVSLTSKPGHGR